MIEDTDLSLSDWNYEPDLGLLPEPTFARYLLMPVKMPSVSAGGIILADETKDAFEYKSFIAKVIKRGPGVGVHPRYREDMQLGPKDYARVGDYVLFPNFQVLRFKVKDASFVLINEDEVRAIIPQELVSAELLQSYKIL